MQFMIGRKTRGTGSRPEDQRNMLFGGLEHDFFSIYWEFHNPIWHIHMDPMDPMDPASCFFLLGDMKPDLGKHKKMR